jgi:hypothetical protein
MATLYEYQTGGSSYGGNVGGALWKAQTFTVGTAGTNENFNISSVKLKLYRVGSPGTLTVSIRTATGGESGTVTGSSDLSSGTFNGNTVTTNTAGQIYEISMSSYTLTASTSYAIVLSASAGDGSNYLSPIRNSQVSPAPYSGGQRNGSTDSGSSWSGLSTDYYFEVYGDSPGVTTTPSAQSLTLTQQTPSYVVNNGTVVTPSEQALSLTQQTPTYALISNPTVTPSALSLTLSTQNPTFNIVTPNYLQSKSIEYNNGTITSKTMTVTGTGILSFYMTADGSNYEQVTNGVLHTFVNTGQNLKYRIYGESGAEVTKVKIT